MNVRKLREIIKRGLQSNKEAANIQPNDILDILNEVYTDFAIKTKCFQLNYNINSIANQAIYSPPIDMFEVINVVYEDGIYPIAKETMDTISVINANWRYANTGTPRYWYMYDANNIALYPKPELSGKNISIYGWVAPSKRGGGIAVLDDDNDVPQMRENFQYALVYGALANILKSYEPGLYNINKLLYNQLIIKMCVMLGNPIPDNLEIIKNGITG